MNLFLEKFKMAEKFYDPKIHKNLNLSKKSDEIAHLDIGEYTALLSCGHACDPNSLTGWCESILNDGRTNFTCPVKDCNQEWSYDEVRRVALLTQDERLDFETKLYNNFANSGCIKPCPKCEKFILREDSNNKIQCLNCSNKRQIFHFCWQCEQKWLDMGSNVRCGNNVCHSYEEEALKNCEFIYLASCPKLGKIPSVRACPSCDKLLEHDGHGCKNITCNKCQVEFCFACLETTKVCQRLKNGYYDECLKPIAPIQTRSLN